MVPKTTRIIVGSDPELKGKADSIGQVKWMDFHTLNKIDPAEKHGILNKVNNQSKLLGLRGFFKL